MPDSRLVGSRPVNLLRLIVITLSLALLVACGGGGGGTAAAPTLPTNTPDPMNPPTNMPGTDDPMTPPPANLESLPSFLATQDLSTLRTRYSGTVPMTTGNTQIVSGVQTTAMSADTITMQNIVIPATAGVTRTPITPDCSAGTSCTASIPNVDTATFSLTGIKDLSLIDDSALERFNSETRAIMDIGDVKVIESRSAGLDSDGTRLAFQTYAGWLDGSVFGHRRIEITEGSNNAVYFASYSFGKASGSKPTARASETSAMWTGVAVGVRRSGLQSLQGTATIEIDDLSVPDPKVDVSLVLREINASGVRNEPKWEDLSLTDGNFDKTDGHRYIEGSFYGDGHEEVGGIFRTLDLYGAFGAKRQP